MRIWDCHAHLDELPDLPAALARAEKAGVSAILAVAVSLATSRKILEISRAHSSPRVLAAIGLYPGEASAEELARVSALIEGNYADLAAIGEIGLDYWIPAARSAGPARDLQQRVFKDMLALTRRFSLVPIVHSRGAWADCLALVKETEIPRAVFHWYTGPAEVLEDLLAAGHFISASPAAVASPPHRAALSIAPLERIVLETDCPVPRRVGEARIPTEPADVRLSLAAVAALKGVSEEEVGRITTESARSLFCGSTPAAIRPTKESRGLR